MTRKKYPTKQQKSKFEDSCYDASSLEEEYEEVNEDDNIDVEDKIDNEEDEERDEDLDINPADIIEIIIEPVEKIGPKKRGPKPVKNQFYVEPKEFDDEIMLYYKNGHIADNLAHMINKIAHKLSYAPNFINYTYRDEMVGDAIVRMMKALIAKKYTHNKGSNPFSYFTKIAFNAFRNRIKKEKYTHEVLQKYQEEIIMNSEYMNFFKNKKSMNAAEDNFQPEE